MEARSDGRGGIVGDGGVAAGLRVGSSSRFISQIFWPEHCLSLGEQVQLRIVCVRGLSV